MIFLSKAGQLRLVLRPETIEYIKVEGSDHAKRVRIPGKTVVFQELRGQGGRGGINPANADPRGFRGIHETEDLEEIELLLNHRSYNQSFVAVSESGSELIDPNAVFFEIGDGRWQCRLNGRIFKNAAGMEGWKRSAEYKELLEAEQGKRKAALVA